MRACVRASVCVSVCVSVIYTWQHSQRVGSAWAPAGPAPCSVMERQESLRGIDTACPGGKNTHRTVLTDCKSTHYRLRVDLAPVGLLTCDQSPPLHLPTLCLPATDIHLRDELGGSQWVSATGLELSFWLYEILIPACFRTFKTWFLDRGVDRSPVPLPMRWWQFSVVRALA